jgi:hypothetical protein
MRSPPGAALATALLVLCGPTLVCAAPPGGVPTVTPVFQQLVAFTLPAPFQTAYEKTSGGYYIREHIRQGETPERWTQMITLTGSRGLGVEAGATPEHFVQALVRAFTGHCPATASSLELGPQTVGGRPAFAAIASCGHIEAEGAAHSEAAVMLTMQGSNDFYTLQWSVRAADSKQPLAIERSEWTARLAKLEPVRLCPIVPGEAPPYPSCASR